MGILVTTNPGAWYDSPAGLCSTAPPATTLSTTSIRPGRKPGRLRFERVSNQPVFSPSQDGFDAGCVEDPRIVKIGDWYYITYATRPFPPGQYWLKAKKALPPALPARIPLVLRTNGTWTGLALTHDFGSGSAGADHPPLVDDRDVILFPEKIGGKYVMMHRPR